MADKSIRGRFVWHELMTPDAGAAHGFYTRVLGWKTQPWEQDPSYTMFAAASGPLGGTWPLETGQPRWIAYIGTDDIEATVREAQELGGRVTKEITSMPNGGQYALLEDPLGAPFGVYASTSSHGPQQAPRKGEYSWHELATDDYQAAFDFYSSLFGWEEVGRHEMGGPVGTYFMFGLDGVATGGIFNRMPEMPPAFWLGYVRVKDVQKMVKKVKSAGGTVLTEPMEVPGGDWIAQFADPNGAIFAVHTLATDLKKGGTEAAQDEEASVTPEEAGTKRHEETAAAAESGEMPASRKAAKRPGKSAAAGTKSTSIKAAKKAGKTSAKKASKQPTKKAAKSATKSKASRSKPAKSKAAKSKATKSKVGKKASKKKASTRARGATRAAKRPARKASKAKSAAQRRPAKKAAKKKISKASKRARRGK
jgi:predicted enzyme related to lactoylglutathione lyase